MITYDVDEAALLSDRIVMMTNGPSAEVGGIVEVKLPRPRRRIEVEGERAYLAARHVVIEFLYARHAALRSPA